jgi:hypothetical protein
MNGALLEREKLCSDWYWTVQKTMETMGLFSFFTYNSITLPRFPLSSTSSQPYTITRCSPMLTLPTTEWEWCNLASNSTPGQLNDSCFALQDIMFSR